MELYVTWRVEGRFTCKVEANSPEEALEKSKEMFYDADFGALEDIGDTGNTYPIIVETEDGAYLYER